MSTTTHTITYATCGHTERTKITWTGGATQRDSKVAWTAANLTCAECRESATIERGRQVAETGTLEGSPKQCAWASDIRDTMLAEWPELRAAIDERAGTDERAAAMLVRGDEIAAITSARWWIDNRGTSIGMILRREHPFPSEAPAAAAPARPFRLHR